MKVDLSEKDVLIVDRYDSGPGLRLAPGAIGEILHRGTSDYIFPTSVAVQH